MDIFDESTYKGRLQKYLQLTNFRHLVHSREKLEKCKAEVESGKNTSLENLRIYASCIHPNTKEIIPPYGRLAFFFPINIPICAGMLLTRPILPNLIGWQWFNQTNNAIFNYSNSAKTQESPKSLEEIPSNVLAGYLGSVSISVSLAIGLTQWVKKKQMPHYLRPMLQTVIPFFATASAGMANVVIMRFNELKTGIPVMKMDNQYVGHSKIAARKALIETALSRAVLPIPMLLAPAPFIGIFSRMHIFRSSYLRRKMMELGVLLPFIAIGLPAALAIYPQYTEISLHALDDHIIAAVNTSMPNNDTCLLKFNKGV